MGEGFNMGLALGSAFSNAVTKGVSEWRSIQLEKQNRREFDGAMALASQRRSLIQQSAGLEEAAQLDEWKRQVQRSPDAQQTTRPTGNVLEDGSPETEPIIRTAEGDIPLQQLQMLKMRKQQAETAAQVAEVDLIMEIQNRYPSNPLVKQWAAATYAAIQQKQEIRAKQVQAQRLQLDSAMTQLALQKFAQEKRAYEEGPARAEALEKTRTDEGIRQDAARIQAQKTADLEVEGVRAQNRPERAPTEFDKKLRQMAPRAQQALETIEALEQGAPDEVYDRTGIGAGVESLTPNALRSGKRQQYEQAALQLINSLLRAESGATITEAEIAKAREQYIPRVGEAPEVVQQKRQARRVAVEELFRAGGEEAPSRQSGGAPAAGGVPEDIQALLGKYGG